MAPPFDKPAHAPGMDWLASLKADIDATTPAEWDEIKRHEEWIEQQIEEIEAGRHPLCRAEPVA